MEAKEKGRENIASRERQEGGQAWWCMSIILAFRGRD
jgi:hypothetical protein